MRIGIIGAKGRLGSLILEEALNRGHNVTVVVRDGQGLRGYRGVKVIEKDLLDLEYRDIYRNDVIINAVGAWGDDDLTIHHEGIAHLIKILEGEDNRLLLVGGSGSLYTDESRTERLMDTKDFPEDIRPLAKSMAQGLELLEKTPSLKWTYARPAADFLPDGKRTGFFKEGGDVLPLDQNCQSRISYADYAIGLITEAERGHHLNESYSLVGR